MNFTARIATAPAELPSDVQETVFQHYFRKAELESMDAAPGNGSSIQEEIEIEIEIEIKSS